MAMKAALAKFRSATDAALTLSNKNAADALHQFNCNIQVFFLFQSDLSLISLSLFLSLRLSGSLSLARSLCLFALSTHFCDGHGNYIAMKLITGTRQF